MQEIKYIAVEKLKVHPNNPRLIEDAQFKILCESVKNNPDYFETRPILCNKNMEIFAGNQRYLAALKIGLKEVPCCVMDISPERQKELMLRDNIQNGQWDISELANWNENLLSMVGVESDILDKIFQEESDEDDFSADDEYEKVKEPKIKRGDLFLLGGEVVCPKCGKIHKL